MSPLKSNITAAIKDEGVTPSVVTITSAEANGWEERGLPHDIALPALYVYAAFAEEIKAELRKRLFDKIIEVIRTARQNGDPIAKKVEEVVLYDGRGEPLKIIERRRVPD